MDCDFEIRAETVDEIMREAIKHAREVHKSGFNPRVFWAARGAIKDE